MPELNDEITSLKRWIDAPGGVLHFWKEILTAEQREQLGNDINRAYERFGGSSGIWVKLHGGSRARAIVDVAFEMGLIDAAKHRRLRRNLGAEVEPVSQSDKPRWDAASGKLYLGNQLVRRVRLLQHPSNVQQILDAFQAAGWPRQIKNPLGGDQQTLHQTLRSLHTGLSGLRFHSQEGGQAVSWELD